MCDPQGLPAVQDSRGLGQEFDLVLQRQRARRPSGGVFGTATAVAAAQVAAASGMGVEAAIKREPPSTPELDTIMDWLTSVNGAAMPSPSTAAIKQLVGAGECAPTAAGWQCMSSANQRHMSQLRHRCAPEGCSAFSTPTASTSCPPRLQAAQLPVLYLQNK